MMDGFVELVLTDDELAIVYTSLYLTLQGHKKLKENGTTLSIADQLALFEMEKLFDRIHREHFSNE